MRESSFNAQGNAMMTSLALDDDYFCQLSAKITPSKKSNVRPAADPVRQHDHTKHIDQKTTAHRAKVSTQKKNNHSKVSKRARGETNLHTKERPVESPETNQSEQTPLLEPRSVSLGEHDKSVELTSTSKSNFEASHIETLREKLLKKIESLRGQRQINGQEPLPQQGSKRAARRLLKEQRRNTASSEKVSPSSSSAQKQSLDNTTLLRKLSDVITASHTEKISVPQDLSGIDFGSFTGLSPAHTTSISDNKSLANLGKKKSLESLLTEAEKKKARLKELKQSEQVEDQQRAANIEWKETLLLASGAKTKDTDPALLKKAIKRKIKKKAKSAEGWKTRMDQIKGTMKQRQDIRSHNLKMRKVGGSVGANLSRKQIQSEDSALNRHKTTKQDKTMNRAGFEGKRQKFINK